MRSGKNDTRGVVCVAGIQLIRAVSPPIATGWWGGRRGAAPPRDAFLLYFIILVQCVGPVLGEL